MLRTVVVLLCVTSVTFAALMLQKPDPKPDKYKNTEGCYIKDIDLVIPFGNKAPSHTGCLEYRCRSDFVQIASCGVALATPPCVVSENGKENPYPKCCPTIECP